MQRATKGRAIFHTRDSGGRHETTPSQYVNWAASKAKELGLEFDGTPSAIERLIKSGDCHTGDLYLDFDVCGNNLERRGLKALFKRVAEDLTVSHVLIPRRDRFARPDYATDGVKLENTLRQLGVTIVFMDRELPPLQKGRRQDIAELIVAIFDYDQAGVDRRKLARNIIYAQLTLAALGCSTGGRAPYGFRRHLAMEDGTLVRELAHGEYVRLKGHHVVWVPLPDDHPEMIVIKRILTMLVTMPASHVAAQLTAEGIRAPDTGRIRKNKKNGTVRVVSDAWHSSTVNNIARNPLLLAVHAYGRRSIGDQLRLTPQGPRELEDSDFRADGKAKIIHNTPESLVRTPARFPSLVCPEKQAALLEILDERGKTQRGKPRSKDPSRNPLGCRVFDLDCGWPLYRQTYGGSFRYLCGLYQQSHGQRCEHNHVDGPTATRFLLNYFKQVGVLSPTFRNKLHERFKELAMLGSPALPELDQRAIKQRELAALESQLTTVSNNLALAMTPKQFASISKVFDGLTESHDKLTAELDDLPLVASVRRNSEADVNAAMDEFDRIQGLLSDGGNFAHIGGAFNLLNVRLYFAFKPVQLKKRVVRRIKYGVAKFGLEPDPIEVHDGPTDRRTIKNEQAAAFAADPGAQQNALPDHFSGREGISLGNVSRGDRT